MAKIDSSAKQADTQSLKQKNRDYILQPASSIAALLDNGPDIINSGKGCTVTDSEGRSMLDAVAGLWCVNAGYGRDDLSGVMYKASSQLAYYHTFSNASNPWQIALAEKLITIAPGKLGKVFFGNGGSDANDTLMKIAWHYHQLKGNKTKTKFIARERAYHGTSISTASLTGLTVFHNEFPLPLDFVLRTDCPHYYLNGKPGESETDFCDRMIANVAELIEHEGADNIAAFFAEPIFAAGGVVPPPEGYFPKLQALLKQHDILLVADEVVCGYGRLGTWFGSEQLGIEPDMMATAKGLTSGYFPLSAAFITDEIWSVLRDGTDVTGGFYHGYTYSGHPVGCAVALANLEVIENEGMIQMAAENGAYLHQSLKDALGDNPYVGEIRGRGLLAGIQLVADKETRVLPDKTAKWPVTVTKRMRDLGVIARPLAGPATIALSPPLIINRAEIDRTVSALADSIRF